MPLMDLTWIGDLEYSLREYLAAIPSRAVRRVYVRAGGLCYLRSTYNDMNMLLAHRARPRGAHACHPRCVRMHFH